MTESLRVALLLDPLSVSIDGPLNLRVKWGNHAPNLARELLGRGHTVRGFGAPPGLIPHSSEVPFEGQPTSVLWSKLAAFRPELLLAYDALSPAAIRGARMARKLGATLVLVESALPGSGRWHERLLSRAGEWMWGGYVRRTAGGVVALDELGRTQALHEGFDDARIRVVPHGVDTNEFRPGLTSTLIARHRVRGRILLYVGRLGQNRGLSVLISAFARTVGQRSDWNLVLAGDGGARAGLRAQVGRLGIADRVHWVPRPRREELPGLMGASTLLAVPARDDAVLGRQLSRALACGLSVVASDLPRLRGLVDHEETGLLVPAGDVEAWTHAIRQAAFSPVARRRWGANGRRVAIERLSWPAVASAYEEVFVAARQRVQAKLARRAGAGKPEVQVTQD